MLHLNEERRPRCAGLLMQFIFFLLGVGILIPWNAYISAKAYFESRLCSTTGSSDHNSLSQNLESTFAIAYNCSSVFTLGILIFFQWIFDSRQSQRATSVSQSTVEDRDSAMQENSGKWHSFFLVTVPLVVYFVVFFLQAVAVLWRSLDPTVFYFWTVGSLALCGLCGALATSGIVATAGLFMPNIAMEPFLAGQSAGGLGVAFANLAAAFFEEPQFFWNAHCNGEKENSKVEYALGNEITDANSRPIRSDNTCVPYSQIDHAVLWYFLLGSIVLAACLVGYCYVERIQQSASRTYYEVVQDHESPNNLPNPTDNTAVDSATAVFEDLKRSPPGVEMNSTRLQQRQTEGLDSFLDDGDTEEENPDDSPAINDALNHLNLHTARNPHTETAINRTESVDSHTPIIQHDETKNETSEVFRIVRSPALCIYLIFFVTLALFPGWLSKLRSIHQCNNIHNRLANDLYTPVAFVVFNAGDLLGRILSAYLPFTQIQQKPIHLVFASICRFLFFPLFYLCVSQQKNSPWEIHSDVYSWTVQLIFGISNGCIVSTAFVVAPSLLPDVKHVQERSAEILTFALSFGLLCGSLFSVPVATLYSAR